MLSLIRWQPLLGVTILYAGAAGFVLACFCITEAKRLYIQMQGRVKLNSIVVHIGFHDQIGVGWSWH
jgi:hypothetical protein